jgi:hypothetical protein
LGGKEGENVLYLPCRDAWAELYWLRVALLAYALPPGGATDRKDAEDRWETDVAGLGKLLDGS